MKSDVMFSISYMDQMTKGPFQPEHVHKNTRNHMNPKEEAASIRLKQNYFDGKATYQE